MNESSLGNVLEASQIANAPTQCWITPEWHICINFTFCDSHADINLCCLLLPTASCSMSVSVPAFLAYLQMAKNAHNKNQTERRAIHPDPVNGFDLLICFAVYNTFESQRLTWQVDIGAPSSHWIISSSKLRNWQQPPACTGNDSAALLWTIPRVTTAHTTHYSAHKTCW